MPTTAAMAGVATANGVKTLLQLATPSTRQLQVISWGFSVSVTPPGISTIELLQTDVGATITQAVAAGIQPLDPNAPASLLDISGTGKTGYTATVEGSTTATRVFDTLQLGVAAGNNQLNYEYQFMPDERPIIAVSKFLRVRTTFTSTTPLVLCWVCWDE
jgi:hypothetical protein